MDEKTIAEFEKGWGETILDMQEKVKKYGSATSVIFTKEGTGVRLVMTPLELNTDPV